MATRYDIAATGLPGNYRGSPARAGGTGSGQGPSQADHTASMRNRWRRRRGGAGNGVTWSPTVINLLVLVAIEIGIYVGLRVLFKSAHGG
jgi:hypothetical protein